MDKTAERLLKASELRYRKLFETAQDGILLLDHDTGMILDVNPFLIDMLGYSKSEFLKKYLWEVGAFKDVFASKKNFIHLKRKGYVRYEDLPLETKWKKKIDVEFVSNVYDVVGKKTIQCNIRDITDRKLLEDELLLAKEREFRAIFDNAGEGIVVIDVKTLRFRMGNKEICRMLGYSPDEIKRLGVKDIHPPKDRPYALDQFKKQIRGTIQLSKDMPLLRKDGSTFYADLIPSKITIDKKRYLLEFFHDTTARKMIEKELVNSKRIMQEKVEEMELFNRMSVGRELKMIELKKRIKELEEKRGKNNF